MITKMMRRTLIVPCCMISAMFVLPVALQAQTGDSQSIERIRAALEREPAIRLPDASWRETPMFRIDVRPPNFIMQPIDEKPFDPTFGLPSVGDLLMGGIGKIGSAAVQYKRARTKRRVRKEVDDALAAFCAIHQCPKAAPN
jgi:hypothetical protein